MYPSVFQPSSPLSFSGTPATTAPGLTPMSVIPALTPPAVPTSMPGLPAAPVAAPAGLGGMFAPNAAGNALGGLYNTETGINWGAAGQIGQGIGALGGLWGAFQQNRLAEETLDFQKEAYQTNLEGTSKSYNTALEDRIRSRYAAEGKSSAEADKYLKKNSMAY